MRRNFLIKYTMILAGAIFLLVFASPLRGQELNIIPGGMLEAGDSAEVTGDYVRIRSGPTLEHRILTKVNRGTMVSIISRGDSLVDVNGQKNYWYRVKLQEGEIEGWIFGLYLRKKNEVKEKITPMPIFTDKLSLPTKIDSTIPLQTGQPLTRKLDAGGIPQSGGTPQLRLKELGSIKEPPSLITVGDLNRNGSYEILFLNREKQGRYWNIAGYEYLQSETKQSRIDPVYRTKLRNSEIETVRILSNHSISQPLIAVSGKRISYIYTYDPGKNLLKPVYKIDSSMLGVGKLDGNGSFLVFLKKNKTPDNDGTQTYTVYASRLDISRSRIILKEKIKYDHPLPVKKLLLFDLDGNGKDEIICEIGGRDSGGGIVVLSFENATLKKTMNWGISTYKDSPFSGLWGMVSNNNKDRRLIIYTVDPENAHDPGTTLGFVIASIKDENLTVEKYYPLNKLLDEVNNSRSIFMLERDEEPMPFLVIDLAESKGEYEIKKLYLSN
jgi:uncharacterized protein YgiM (DUF1202 family)